MFPFKGLCQQVGSQVYFCNTHGTRICMYCDIRLLFGFRSQSILVLFSQLSFPECMTRLISPCLTDRSKGAWSVHKGRQGFLPSHPLRLAPCTHITQTNNTSENIRKMVDLVEKARWIRIVAIIQFVFICLCTFPIPPLPCSYLSLVASVCCRMVTDLSSLCMYCA